jgi:P4 family phage/plasmid primase-like protien
MDVQVKLIALENEVKRLQENWEKAEERCARNPTEDRRYKADCAKSKLLEAGNKLAALQAQVELDQGAQEEKTKQDDQDSGEIVAGLQEYFGTDGFDKLSNNCGFSVNPTQFSLNPNEVWWGAATFHPRKALFCPAYDDFYVYHPNNGLWAPVSEDKLTAELNTLLVEMDKKVFKKQSIRNETNEKFRRDAIRSQRGYLENTVAFIEKKPQHVQVQNGVLTFKDGRVRLDPFSPDYYSLHASPLAYDPDAQCPKFEALLAHLDPDDIDVIQRAAGMFLLGRNLAQKIFLFEGVGRSRKTTITRVIELVLGKKTVTQLRTAHLNERFELYRLYQKSLLIGPDVKEDFLQDEGAEALKRLTGGDLLTAEGKGSNKEFSFYGDLNVLITTNSYLLLRVRTDAEAWKRRLVLVIFPPAPEAAEQYQYWDVLFEEEGAGVLRWMADGANRLLQDFRENRGFVLTDAQRKRAEIRIDESDSAAIFLKERVERATGDEGITSEDLLIQYGDFCQRRDWGQPSTRIVQKRFAEIIPHIFGGEDSNKVHPPGNRLKNVRGYRGVKWKDVPRDSAQSNGNGEGMNLGRMLRHR